MNIWILTALLILSLGGIYICRLIILHLIDPAGQRLCKTDEKFDCDRVLNSDLGKINQHINLADVGLVYFIAQSLLIVLAAIAEKSAGITVLFVPSLLAMAMTFISLFYQAFIIKGWCKMCLIVAGIVWLQTGMLTANAVMEVQGLAADVSSIGLLVVSLLLACIWFLVKSAIMDGRQAATTNRKLTYLKNNPNVFRAILKTQRTVPIDIWEDDFLLGNRRAPTRLIVTMNPYCRPCAREYERLFQLLQAHPRTLGVAIRFVVTASADTRHTRAVRYLLQEYAASPPDLQPLVLQKWFDTKLLPTNSDPASKSSPELEAQNDLLQRYQQWWQVNNIRATPTVFINGYEFPRLYATSDLNVLLPKLARRPLKASAAKEKNV